MCTSRRCFCTSEKLGCFRLEFRRHERNIKGPARKFTSAPVYLLQPFARQMNHYGQVNWRPACELSEGYLCIAFTCISHTHFVSHGAEGGGGGSGPLDNLVIHRFEQRGWRRRGCLLPFFDSIPQLHIDCIQRQAGVPFDHNFHCDRVSCVRQDISRWIRPRAGTSTQEIVARVRPLDQVFMTTKANIPICIAIDFYLRIAASRVS